MRHNVVDEVDCSHNGPGHSQLVGDPVSGGDGQWDQDSHEKLSELDAETLKEH